MSGPLVNFGDLTKPATILVERISDAVGGIAKPWQMRRVARAEADAEMIKANARIKISEIERRALVRMVREEARKQKNIEEITAKALPFVTPDAKPENVETDWIAHFFDRCRLISDDEMQTLWASILTGEANKPGSFSKRTIDLVATLDKRDAQLFNRLCSYVWHFEGKNRGVFDDLVPIIENVGVRPSGQGFIFMDLVHLDSIGLTQFSNSIGYIRVPLTEDEDRILASYFGKKIGIDLDASSRTLATGCTVLTQSGAELAQICKAAPLENHFVDALYRWANNGAIIFSPLPQNFGWVN
jgi:hypothetical protein